MNCSHWASLFFLNAGCLIVVAWLLKQNPHISGSGIPQVEGVLTGEITDNWWATLWRKFTAGILAIGSGLMLGREGPSIQLGAAIGQGVAKYRHLSHNKAKSLIASGAAAGLSAAFNAPLAGVMFVLEEIYHSISPFVWVGGCHRGDCIGLCLDGHVWANTSLSCGEFNRFSGEVVRFALGIWADVRTVWLFISTCPAG